MFTGIKEGQEKRETLNNLFPTYDLRFLVYYNNYKEVKTEVKKNGMYLNLGIFIRLGKDEYPITQNTTVLN